jgi:hypothetical protein
MVVRNPFAMPFMKNHGIDLLWKDCENSSDCLIETSIR